MPMKYSILATSIVFALSGCGGSDDSDSSTAPSTHTIQGIDGYLYKAEVYVDRNADFTASVDELVGLTSESGEFSIAEDDAAHNVILRAVAGKTIDMDSPFTAITNTYEMIANSGSSVVTPYTTLSVVSGKTFAELASELNVDEAIVSGDYLDHKNSTDPVTEQAAEKAHLIARSLATTLPQDILDAKTTPATVETSFSTIKQEVDTIAPSEYEKTIVKLDSSGQPAKEYLPVPFLEFLIGKKLHVASMHNDTFGTDGFITWDADVALDSQGKLALTNNVGSLTVTVVDNQLVFESDTSSYSETVFYTSEVDVDESGNVVDSELILISKTDQGEVKLYIVNSGTYDADDEVLDASLFNNKEYYLILDEKSDNVAVIKKHVHDYSNAQSVTEANRSSISNSQTYAWTSFESTDDYQNGTTRGHAKVSSPSGLKRDDGFDDIQTLYYSGVNSFANDDVILMRNDFAEYVNIGFPETVNLFVKDEALADAIVAAQNTVKSNK